MDLFLSGFLDSELWTRLLVAFFCGLIVGLERQLRGKPVGVRTSSLICIGSMFFIFIAEEMQGRDSQDVARILGQLVTGIGFIGAGVIMTRKGHLNGVTSAATIWVLAGVGAAVGFGAYGRAAAVAVATVFVLTGFEYFERATQNTKSTLRKMKRNRLFPDDSGGHELSKKVEEPLDQASAH